MKKLRYAGVNDGINTCNMADNEVENGVTLP